LRENEEYNYDICLISNRINRTNRDHFEDVKYYLE